MNRRLLAALLPFIVVNTAAAHQLNCPAQSPADWGNPQTPLSEISVLAYPSDPPLSPDDAPPAQAPVERERRGVIYQVWNMNLSPGDNDQVDCLYTWNGKDRALRLDANHVKHCWAELQYKDIKTMKITKITFYCD